MVANTDWFVEEDDWRTHATAWPCPKSHVAAGSKMTTATQPTVQKATNSRLAPSGSTSHAASVLLMHKRHVNKSVGGALVGAIPTRLKQGRSSPEFMSPGGLLSPDSGLESRTDTPIQTPAQEVVQDAQVLGFNHAHNSRNANASTWKEERGDNGDDDEPLPEEVILVPTTTNTVGRASADQVCDDHDSRSPVSHSSHTSTLLSPASASTVDCNVKSPGPISQASSPNTVIQFTTVPSKDTNDYGHDSVKDLESELGSPYSFLSTPETAIPSPYNKLVRPSLNASSTIRGTTEEYAAASQHQPETMTMADAPVYQSQLAASSRWSKAPADLPQNYFGTGLAVVRPPIMANTVSYDTSMTPPTYASQQWKAPVAPTGRGIDVPAYSGHYESFESSHHVEAPALPLQFQGQPTGSHRVLQLNEDTAVALAYWFAGRIVNRLAYSGPAVPSTATSPAAQAASRQGRRSSDSYFDPYHVVPGHSYVNGQVTVASDLAFNMYQILERVQSAETLLAAAYFLERLPFHEVDGHFGREFRTHLVPRRAGDISFALERRVAALCVMLAQNTLEDRDYHLPNNIMWQIGGMEKTRFNRLKLLVLQDLDWNVHIPTDVWHNYISKVGTELSSTEPALEHEHVEILTRAFTFMYDVASQTAHPTDRYTDAPQQHLVPIVETCEASREPTYEEPVHQPVVHKAAPALRVGPQTQPPLRVQLTQRVVSATVAPSMPAPIAAPIVNAILDGSYKSRKAMQEARAQRAREAYLHGKLLPTPPPAPQPTPVETQAAMPSASELHQRRKAAQEARARRARAAYLQKTYLRGGRSAAMILA